MFDKKQYFRQYYQAHKKEHRNVYKKICNDVKQGGCVLCGYDKCLAALEFHHVRDKSFEISKVKRSKGSLKKELEKCICVCANCHREIHAGKIEKYENYTNTVESIEELPLLKIINGGVE